MTGLDRRQLMALGLGAAAAGARPASAGERRSGRANAPEVLPRPRIESKNEQEPVRPPRVEVRPPLRRVNAVKFWAEAALALNALDHSVEAANARAPGPCAATRALGLAYAAMADAVAAVYPVDFDGCFVANVRYEGVEYPEAFVGGACAQILEHIYSTPAHSHLLGMLRIQFLRLFEGQGVEAWKAGLAFGRRREFLVHWKWNEIKYAAVNSSSLYRPHPGKHDVDPFNPDQKFYGVKWGDLPPLVPEIQHSAVGPGAPPTERDREFRHDAEEVRELGLWRPGPPTREQVRLGLFWAYDGARLIGTPNRQYTNIVLQILEHDGFSPPEMARALALCNLALADASIVTWANKYHYNVWRPVRALPSLFPNTRFWRPFGAPRTNPTQFALGVDTRARLTAVSVMGGGYRVVAIPTDKNVLSYPDACFTPNFPSYPSGHASFGAACFRTLQLIRAERQQTHGEPGRLAGFPSFVSDELNGTAIDNFQNELRPLLPTTFRDIDQIIDENNRSRVHLGVHWNFDCRYGAESGAKVAQVVYRNVYRRVPHAAPQASRIRGR